MIAKTLQEYKEETIRKPIASSSAVGLHDCCGIARSNTIYDAEARQASFQQVDSVLLRVLDESDAELMSYELGREFTVETAIVIGELYRYGAEWKFHAIGKGFSQRLERRSKQKGLQSDDAAVLFRSKSF